MVIFFLVYRPSEQALLEEGFKDIYLFTYFGEIKLFYYGKTELSY